MTSTPLTHTPPPGPPPAPTRPLRRSRTGRMLGGVCAGLAERFGLTATQVRVLAVVSCLLPGPQFLGYLALWVAMPSRDG